MASKMLIELEKENPNGSIICGYSALDIEAAIQTADKEKLKLIVGPDPYAISGVCEIVKDWTENDPEVETWVTVWSQPWSLQAKYDRIN